MPAPLVLTVTLTARELADMLEAAYFDGVEDGDAGLRPDKLAPPEKETAWKASVTFDRLDAFVFSRAGVKFR